MSGPVKLTGSHTQPPQEQQTHTHDGEDTGGTNSTCTQTQAKLHLCLQQVRSVINAAPSTGAEALTSQIWCLLYRFTQIERQGS